MALTRHDWYQSDTDVTIEIFAKQVDAASVQVRFERRQVVVQLAMGAAATPAEELCRTFNLARDVCPEECRFSVGRVKVEIVLRKGSVGVAWPTLEDDNSPAPTALGYPSSSRVKHEWGKIEQAMAAEAPDGESESVDDFFKGLYSNASDEARRAMIKSFVESKGTVLSTNWDEVGSKKVQPAPPKGVGAEGAE